MNFETPEQAGEFAAFAWLRSRQGHIDPIQSQLAAEDLCWSRDKMSQ